MDGSGLRAERVVAPSGRVGWTVVDAVGVAVAPAEAFLRHRFDCEASPNTLRAYAHDLKLFFGFLAERSLGWRELTPADLGEFVAWLRRPAGSYGKAKPLRRAARHEGFFPVNLGHPDQLAELVADVTALRKEAGKDGAEPYDVIAALPPGREPAPYAAVGARGGWWSSRGMRYRSTRCAA